MHRIKAPKCICFFAVVFATIFISILFMLLFFGVFFGRTGVALLGLTVISSNGKLETETVRGNAATTLSFVLKQPVPDFKAQSGFKVVRLGVLMREVTGAPRA